MAHLNFLREPFGSPYDFHLFLIVIFMQIYHTLSLWWFINCVDMVLFQLALSVT